MGFTAEMIAQALQAQGWTWDGSVGGLYLPTTDDDPNVVSARNCLRSDWTQISISPPAPGPSTNYNQEYDNFDGTAKMVVQFSHDVSVTTATDYSLTQSFDVGVNLSIPLGDSGALLGFNATMSATQVSSKSETTTDTRHTEFPVTIPGGQGRKVDETTSLSTVTATYEAAIGVQNCVGIWIDNPWYESNEYIWFLHIEDVFPELSAKSQINIGSVSTGIDTSITKVTKPDNGGKATEPLSLSSEVIPSKAPQDDVTFRHPIQAVMGKPQKPAPGAFDQTLNVVINFGTTTHTPVPLAYRHQCADALRMKIMHTVHGGIQAPSTVAYHPSNDPATATFSIKYDAALISQQQLKGDVLTAASGTDWHGGSKSITFH